MGMGNRTVQITGILVLAIGCMLLNACGTRHEPTGPYLEFTRVPPADQGGPDKLDVIEGVVVGDHSGLRVVVFARSGAWYIQPFANDPVVRIQSDSKWKSPTHLGTEYAALLVEPGFEAAAVTDALPHEGSGVIAVAIVNGEPVFWRRWWFLLLCLLASISAVTTLYSYRLHRSARRLNLGFEARLDERTRVAQELHDTLLQGVISTSMQLHIAVDSVPDDLPAKTSLTHVLEVIGQVIEEGHSALHRVRSSVRCDSLDVEQAFSRIGEEFAAEAKSSFRITVEGHSRPLHPIIRDEVYRIGRELLINAFRHSEAKRIAVKVVYSGNCFRVVIRDEGCANGPERLRSVFEDERGLGSVRERAQGIGARLKVRRRAGVGTEVELSVPGNVAFESQRSNRSLFSWLS